MNVFAIEWHQVMGAVCADLVKRVGVACAGGKMISKRIINVKKILEIDKYQTTFDTSGIYRIYLVLPSKKDLSYIDYSGNIYNQIKKPFM